MTITIDTFVEKLIFVWACYGIINLALRTVYKSLNIRDFRRMANIWPLSLPFVIIGYTFGLVYGFITGLKSKIVVKDTYRSPKHFNCKCSCDSSVLKDGDLPVDDGYNPIRDRDR